MGRSGAGLNYRYMNTRIRHPCYTGWQFFQSAIIYFLCKPLISSLAPLTTHSAAAYSLCTTLVNPLMTLTLLRERVYDFHLFLLSNQMFSNRFSLIFSPPPVHQLSPIKFLIGVCKLIFVNEGQPMTFDQKQRVGVTFKFLHFLAFSGLTASVSVNSISGCYTYGALVRGFVVGLFYASHYRRWVLDFPIVQRRPFFLYKLGFLKAVTRALKLSSAGYLLTLVVPVFINYKSELATRDLIMEQIVFYLALVVVFLCWELNRNLMKVLFTKRLIFAPPKESEAAQLNPSDHLLTVLEDTTLPHDVRYLVYYDLLLVSESNVEKWRRDALFEETGDTYRRVITACLKPLEQLILDLTSNHLPSSTSRLNEPFYDFQILTWCSRIVSSLTVRSQKEDRFGVAHFTGSNAATITTLLSSLVVVEAFMGKETQLPSTNQCLTCHAYFRATVLRSTREDTITRLYQKNIPQYSKAYSMADILRTSIYQIVSLFHQQMLASSKAGRLQKEWITSDKPLYGSGELLVHKLCMFLEFEAN
ncbi:hypothetical protein L2E82_51434 [Cichorium intybus]|nr:hypothetical protein L2E82_51434 [Cichorium intybus]